MGRQATGSVQVNVNFFSRAERVLDMKFDLSHVDMTDCAVVLDYNTCQNVLAFCEEVIVKGATQIGNAYAKSVLMEAATLISIINDNECTYMFENDLQNATIENNWEEPADFWDKFQLVFI